MCLIVGFCGHSGVGKDTCARLLPVVMPGVTVPNVNTVDDLEALVDSAITSSPT